MYSKDEDFFKRMNNDVAYVLGFTVADGCVYVNNKQRRAKNGTKDGSSGTYRISWTSTDYPILKFIQTLLKTDQPIHRRPISYYKRYGYKQTKTQWVLQINSKEMVVDLITRGITPRKSKTVLFDVGVPDEFMPDYIRGIFDGDGSIGEYVVKNRKATNLRSSFTSGSRRLLEDLGSYLKDRLCIIPKIRMINSGAYQLNYGIKETVALCRFMYKDLSSFALERKKAVYDNFMKRRPGFSTRRCSSCGRKFVTTTGLQVYVHNVKI